MFYSKTAALAQHVGEITKILNEIYRDTDKKISDIELRNRAQCLILLGYTLRRRKTNKPFVPAEKSEWIQLYNNGACAMKDYCDMGMQVYVAKKCEDVKCLIVPGCAGGGGGGGGGGSKRSSKRSSGGDSSSSGGSSISSSSSSVWYSDLLEQIQKRYQYAFHLNNNYQNTEMQQNFKLLENFNDYIINNCKTMSAQHCKKIIFQFDLYYKLCLDIEKILNFNEIELKKYFANLMLRTNNFCSNEIHEYGALTDSNLRNKMKSNFTNAEYLLNELKEKSGLFYKILGESKESNKLESLQEAVIYILELKPEYNKNKIR